MTIPASADVIEFREHEPVDGLSFDADTVRALSASPYVAISPSPTGDGWALRAKQYVGTLRVGSTEIRIHPKITVGNLLFLLAYTKDQRGWLDLVTQLDPSTDLVTAVAMGFVRLSALALEQGVLQGYTEREDALHIVRGRIRTNDQLSNRFGLVLPLEVRFDEFTADIPENQILRTALEQVALMPGPPPNTARRARHLSGRLEGVSIMPARTPIPSIRFTRLNERYRGAVILGSLLLQSRAVRFSRGSVKTTGFLFDMNRVFEDFVSAALAERFARGTYALRTQHELPLDIGERIWLRPDLTWWHGQRCLGVADLKYKSLEYKDLPNADVYQLVTYCVAHGVPVGHLVYGEGNRLAGINELRRGGIRIDVHVLDLTPGPASLLHNVDALYNALVASGAEVAAPSAAHS